MMDWPAYGYDDGDQLLSINYDQGATHIGELTYSYDNSGRRTGMGGSLAKLLMPATVTLTSYNAANQLTQWGATAIAYDDNGNMLAAGAASYTWNARDELSATSEASGSYAYDAAGRRRTRTVSGTPTNYLHDGANLVTVDGEEMLAGMGMDEIYTRIGASSTLTRLTDALGSTVALADDSGNITANYSYGAYGQVSKTGSADTSFQYTGRENDGSSNLYYYRARYYSPQFNRFISEDPIGLAGGINTFAYVLGDPISLIDPTGLHCWSKAASNGLIGAANGFVSGLSGGIVGALVGAALGGGVSYEAVKLEEAHMFQSSTTEAVGGGIAGGMAGMLEGSAPRNLAGGIVGAIVGTGTSKQIGGVAGDAIGGGLGGFLGGLIAGPGKTFGPGLRDGLKGGLFGVLGGLAGGAAAWLIDATRDADCECASK